MSARERSETPGSPLLALESISAGYGTTTVLRDVDLVVQPNSVTAVIGRNGAGKTTLLRVVAGLIKPSHGTIAVRGRDMTADRALRRARAGVCLIPEGRGVFPRLTVRENLLLQTPPWTRKHSLDVALDAFPILRARLGTPAGMLSGGQQQMLAICRCYLANPQLILLDEVSMGLAPKAVDQIFESLHSLAASGVGMVLVEQYVGHALQIADQVVMLTRGSVTFSRRPEEVDQSSLIRDYLGGPENAAEDLQAHR